MGRKINNMSRELNMDTKRLNFWKESIEKEAMARVLARNSRDKKGLTAEKMIEQRKLNGESRISRAKKMVPKVNLEPLSFPPVTPQEECQPREAIELVDIMKPVSANTKNRIMVGLSKEGGGRSDYLRARKELAPSDKFNFQACSSWDYGWSIQQFQHNYKPSKFARTPIVSDTFYRRNGVSHKPIDL